MGVLPVLALLAAIASAAPAIAQSGRAAPPHVLAVAGGYELANDNGTRKCLLLLRPGNAPGGLATGFPASCRLSLPVLSRVTAWTLEQQPSSPRARIRLIDGKGAIVLDFKDVQTDGSVTADDGANARYHLKPSTGATLNARIENLKPEAPQLARPKLEGKPDAAAMARTTGTYTMIRAGKRDTGCILALRGTASAGIASLTPGCADKGIVFFGPSGWSISAGTLWLTGTKGRLSFESNRVGGWDKSPGQGEALTLRLQSSP